MELVNLSAAEVMEGITTTLTSVSFSDDSVDLIPSTFDAETTVVFPT
jgi:hypothetical protein